MKSHIEHTVHYKSSGNDSKLQYYHFNHYLSLQKCSGYQHKKRELFYTTITKNSAVQKYDESTFAHLNCTIYTYTQSSVLNYEYRVITTYSEVTNPTISTALALHMSKCTLFWVI